MYYKRIADKELLEWAQAKEHKPLLLRGARQVGKSTAIRHLGERFEVYLEINFEKQPIYRTLFDKDLDVKRIIPLMAAMSEKEITPGKTLLFLDEIQFCPKAIMALRFFKEDMPDLHVVAAGSLLEFALEELPTFGVGRIRSLFMYPMTFDEFLMANGAMMLMDRRDKASPSNPLDEMLHEKLIEYLRIFILVGGMPECVKKWVETHDFLQCQQIQDDILSGYEDDFPKYKKVINPKLLRDTLGSVATQAGSKFVYAQVPGEYKATEVRGALEMLIKAGLIIPVTHSDSNGLPLGGSCNTKTRKMLLMDTGLMLRLESMNTGDTRGITTHILTSRAADLVNKGSIAEMLFGLEYLHYAATNIRMDLFYWVRQARNSLAEIDYVIPCGGNVMPVEVKAGVQGGMKSLWEFMREKKSTQAIRCSLENYGKIEYVDEKAEGTVRHVNIFPLYAVSSIISK